MKKMMADANHETVQGGAYGLVIQQYKRHLHGVRERRGESESSLEGARRLAEAINCCGW